MADSNQSRRADYSDFADNDPFAELTRIMGHDPRAAEAKPVADDTTADAADFELNLERELLGELDFAEFDAPQAAEVAEQPAGDWRDDVAAPSVEQTDAAPQPDFEVDHRVEDFAASIMDAYEADEAELHAQSLERPADAPGTMRPVDIEEASLDDLLERELSSWGAPAPAAAGPSTFEQDFAPDTGLEPAEADAHAAPMWDDAEPAAPGNSNDLASSGDKIADDIDTAFAELGALDGDHADTHEADFAGADAGDALATVEPASKADFPVAESAELPQSIVSDDIPAEQAAEDDFTLAAAPQVVVDEPSYEEPADAPSELSLEDELNALLSSGETQGEAESGAHELEDLGAGAPEEPVELSTVPYEEMPVGDGSVLPEADGSEVELDLTAPGQDETFDYPLATSVDSEPTPAPLQPAPVQPEWRPSVSTFGRANFAASRPAPVEQPAMQQAVPQATLAKEPESVAVAQVPEWDEPVSAEMPYGASDPGMKSGDVTADMSGANAAQVDDDIFGSIFADTLAVESSEPASEHAAAELDEVLAHFSVTGPRDAQSRAAEEAAGSTPAAAAEAPEVETIDVAEAAYAMSDDLDIPEIDYSTQAPQAAAYDDLEGEFAHSFDEAPTDLNSRGERDAGTAAAAWNGAHAFAAPQMPTAAPQQPSQEASDAYALGEGGWQADHIGLSDDFSFDEDFDQALANSAQAFDESAASSRNRRGLLVAAAVAGIAVLGGLGVLGMSLLGGGTDAPAVVRADPDPMKVRPENPGGTVVPNQDSEAYNRVSGNVVDPSPEQESLITTAEEPVDLAIETAPPPPPAGLDDGAEELALAEPDPAETSAAPIAAPEAAAPGVQPKGEDRIEQAAEEPEGVGAAGDLVAVTPRKVRTMIVRPDGTMVPREEATPSPAEEETVVAAAPLAAPALAPAAVPPVEEAAPIQTEAAPTQTEEDAGPTVQTPDTVAVVPSQRSEPQQPAPTVAAVQPAAARPAEPAPDATPVSAPAEAAPTAAATSEWSMQIASQPTAESAQSTYQDLARRYGSVLEGKGVNIVRADIAGKGVYYRVRIPASSRDEAIRLCTQYKSAGGSCFVSR